MIATQHPVVASGSDIPDLKSCVVNGKVSRIQDGYLVHTHAQPRTRYEGVHFVIANCVLRRCSGTKEFELVGEVGKSFLQSWNDVVHRQICNDQAIPFFENPRTTFRVHTKNTKWFKFEEKYISISPSSIHSESKGFAVIMTRGPWFHASKRNVHTTWHLVEWISC
jgi:hypothetical protein